MHPSLFWQIPAIFIIDFAAILTYDTNSTFNSKEVFMTTERMDSRYVFKTSHLDFGHRVTFDEAFPEIEEINVRVIEIGDDIPGNQLIRDFAKDTLTEYIKCSHPNCADGGFSIGCVIREMVQSKQTHRVHITDCRGVMGPRKRWLLQKGCCHQFTITIDIKY
jgi:hypothetical protein